MAVSATAWFDHLLLTILAEVFMKICKVDGCNREKSISNKYSKLCEIHRYNWYKYKSYERPIKKLTNGIFYICKVHGELTIEKTRKQKSSYNDNYYYKCKICRNEIERNRLNKTKYLTTPRKHIKHKLPEFIHEKHDKIHAYTILNRFKITALEYYEMLEKQNHVCKICKCPETMRKRNSNKPKMLAIDHCHSTNIIRGLLCHKCNVGLGSFKDSIEYLGSAIEYLKATNR
jgi:hypothetical protein